MDVKLETRIVRCTVTGMATLRLFSLMKLRIKLVCQVSTRACHSLAQSQCHAALKSIDWSHIYLLFTCLISMPLHTFHPLDLITLCNTPLWTR